MNNDNIIPKEFTPLNSGTYNRFLNKEQIQQQGSSAIAQTLGIKKLEPVENANTPYYQGQVNFPQPSVVGFGKVTSAGAKSTPFLADNWTSAKNSTGNYTITHNIGNTNYVVLLTAEDTAARIIDVSGITSSKFDVETYSDAGTQTDTAFHFIVYTT